MGRKTGKEIGKKGTLNERTNEMVTNGIQKPLKKPATPSSRQTLAAKWGTVIGCLDACSLLFNESRGYPANVDTKLAAMADTTGLLRLRLS